MALHIIKLAGPPNGITPTELGMHFIDTLNQDTYLSAGTSSPADWILQGGAASAFTTFVSLLDTPASYPANSAGKSVIVGGSEDFLEFKFPELNTLEALNLTNLQNLAILFYNSSSQKWENAHRMNWRNVWTAGTYYEMEVVIDGVWTMVANKTTIERAAPQNVGDPAYFLPDVPTWTETSNTTNATTGVVVTLDVPAVIDGIRAWRPSALATVDYSVALFNATDPQNKILLLSENMATGAEGWVDVGIPSALYGAGTVLEAYLYTKTFTNSGSWTHTWTLQDVIGGAPASGTYTRNATHDFLKINKFADGAVDVNADLAALKAGDQIVFFEFTNAARFNTYEVTSTPTLNVDVYEIDVLRIGNGQDVRAGRLVQADATVNQSILPSDYVYIANWWASNPPISAGTVAQGYLKTDPSDAENLNSNGYGIDLRGTEVIKSDDWDIMSFNSVSGGGGGGGGGASIFTDLDDVPNSYVNQGGKQVVVNQTETGVVFTDPPVSGVSSFGPSGNPRSGDVVTQAGDYTAGMTGADTSAEVTTKVNSGITDHVNQPNPHQQYLLPEDIPDTITFYLENGTSPFNAAYKVSSGGPSEPNAPDGDIAREVSVFTAGEAVTVPFQNWMNRASYGVTADFSGSNSRLTLDLESTSSNVLITVVFGVYLADTDQYINIGQEFITDVTVGRAIYSIISTLPEGTIVTPDAHAYFQVYVARVAAGPEVEVKVHYCNDYISKNSNIIAGTEYGLMAISTSILSGCLITANVDPTLFDMSAGQVINVDSTTNPGTPVAVAISVPERLGVAVTNIGTQAVTYLSIDISGNIVQREFPSTPSQRRDTADVGTVVHPDFTNIVSIVNAHSPTYDVAAQLNDFMEAVGFFITSGNEVTGVSAALSIDKAVGTGFSPGINVIANNKDPHTAQLPAQTPADMFYIKQDNLVFLTGSLIDPTQYDNAGTLTAVPNNNDACIHWVYLFGDNTMAWLQAQEFYPNFSAALDAVGGETMIVPPLLSGAVHTHRIVIQKNTTDMSDAAKVKIIATGNTTSSGSGGASSDTSMQQSYNVSIQPQVLLNGQGGIIYQDGATPLTEPLFRVQNNALTAALDYLRVESDAVSGQKFIDLLGGFDSSIGFVGKSTGNILPNATSIKLGDRAGENSIFGFQIAIGKDAGRSNAAAYAIAIGTDAGEISQGSDAIALGSEAGYSDQGGNAIAIGNQAGKADQGISSIAIGVLAATVSQGANGILISSRGTAVENTNAGHIHLESDDGSVKYDGAGTPMVFNMPTALDDAATMGGTDASLATKKYVDDAGGGGGGTFDSLTDTPITKVANNLVEVNPGADALIYSDKADLPISTDTQTALDAKPDITSATGDMDGDFTVNGKTWTITKVGTMVIFAWESGNHSNASSATTGTPIPVEYRPSLAVSNVYVSTSSEVRMGQMRDTGLFTTSYKDWSGADRNKTSSGGGSLCWSV